jgi:hypothetical protein
VTIPDATDAIGAAVSDFPTFFGEAEPRLRRALVSRYGFDAGREATAAARAWGFEHWSELRTMTNPTGYLFRVGCSRARPRRRRALFEAPVQHEPHTNPACAMRSKGSRRTNARPSCPWPRSTGTGIVGGDTARRRGVGPTAGPVHC